MGSDQNSYYLHHHLQQQQQQQQQLDYSSLPSSSASPRLLNVQDWSQASNLVMSGDDQFMNRYMEEMVPNSREDQYYWANNIDSVPSLKTSSTFDQVRGHETFLHNTPTGSLSDSFLKLCNSAGRQEADDDALIDLNQNLWNMNSFSACPPGYNITSSVLDNIIKYTNSYDNEASFPPRNQLRDIPSNSSSNQTISTSRKDEWRNNKHPKPTNACGEDHEAVAKKPRSAPQSSSPTLKVRKEKLGDRVAALHRMVSPFGKTDTASVLTESIGYIQFLQGQIQNTKSWVKQPIREKSWNINCLTDELPHQRRLSMTYSKPSCPTTRGGRTSMKEHDHHEEEEKQDLSSRGLCLVPLDFTSYVFSLN